MSLETIGVIASVVGTGAAVTFFIHRELTGVRQELGAVKERLSRLEGMMDVIRGAILKPVK